MFEDATFESQGRIHTRSSNWMLATLLFNGSILLTLILIPLLHPDSLPNELRKIVIPEGKYSLSIGGGQPDTGVPTASSNFTIAGTEKLPE